MAILPLLLLFLSSFATVRSNDADTIPNFEQYLQQGSPFRGYVTLSDMGRVKCKKISFGDRTLTFHKLGLGKTTVNIENVLLVERERLSFLAGIGVAIAAFAALFTWDVDYPERLFVVLTFGAVGALLGSLFKIVTTVYVRPTDGVQPRSKGN
jgi:hypothetical protein